METGVSLVEEVCDLGCFGWGFYGMSVVRIVCLSGTNVCLGCFYLWHGENLLALGIAMDELTRYLRSFLFCRLC